MCTSFPVCCTDERFSFVFLEAAAAGHPIQAAAWFCPLRMETQEQRKLGYGGDDDGMSGGGGGDDGDDGDDGDYDDG